MDPRVTLAAFAILTACTEPDDANGGQFGEETGAGCVVSTETALELDEVSELGVTPQELLDLADGAHTVSPSWSDGSTASLTVTVADVENPRFVTYEYDAGDSGIEPAFYCPSAVAFDISLGVESDDGALAESFETTLALFEESGLSVWVELEDLSGTFDPTDYATSSYDEVWADLGATFDEGGMSGEIVGYGETTSGSGPDGTVSLEQFVIASFGGSEEEED